MEKKKKWLIGLAVLSVFGGGFLLTREPSPTPQELAQKAKLEAIEKEKQKEEEIQRRYKLADESLEKEPQMSILFAEKILPLRSEDERALTIIGTAHLKLSNYHDSKDYFKRVLRINPENKQAQLGFGISLSELQEDDERAMYHLRKAQELDENNPDVYYTMSTIHKRNGDKKLALEEVKKAIELKKKDGLAHFLAAEIYFEMKDLKKTEQYLTQAIEHGYPTKYVVYALRGAVRSDLKRYRDAVADFEMSVSNFPNGETPPNYKFVHSMAASAYKKMGDITKAGHHAREFLHSQGLIKYDSDYEKELKNDN